MRGRAWRLAVIVSTLALTSRPTHAQSPAGALTRAIAAYQQLDYDVATALLRRLLARPAPDTLVAADRLRALAYLGASEWFRGGRDSAAAVFRRLIAFDPRYRPDPLVFPPEITDAYAAVRRETKVVAVRAPPDTTIQPGQGRFAVWLFASSTHVVTIALLRENGSLERTLYAGPIGDSLEMRWDGLDSTGAPIRAGAHTLSVTSQASPARVVRIVHLPLDVRRLSADTLPAEAPLSDSQFLPERTTGRHTVAVLATGVAGGAAVAVLPAVVASGVSATGARFGVAGLLGVAGVVEFFRRGTSRPIPQNIAANRALREAWQRRAQAVEQENARRRREARLAIHLGAPVTIEGPEF